MNSLNYFYYNQRLNYADFYAVRMEYVTMKVLSDHSHRKGEFILSSPAGKPIKIKWAFSDTFNNFYVVKKEVC